MAYTMTLPSLSAGMEDAVIARFLKQPGQRIEKGEVLAEVETDKAIMELEAEASGTLADFPVREGDRVKVGDPVALLLVEGEEAPASAAKPANAVSSPMPLPQAATAPYAAADPSRPRHAASPLARRLASAAQLDLSPISGSGPHGRIVRIDVEKALAAGSKANEVPATAGPVQNAADIRPQQASAVPAGIGAYETVPHSAMRRTIARRLMEAKSTVPHFYLEADFEIDALLELRARINAGLPQDRKISVNDFVIKAVAAGLRAVPDVNVIFTEEAMLKLAGVDIAVAVATPGGLMTPIIRDADRKSIGTISDEVKRLAARAQENALRPEEFQGGGFTISNLGMYGVSAFSAIINPPQSAILAVGAGEWRAVVRGDDLAAATVMHCVLSVDHRAIDGAVAATFLKELKTILEAPLRIIA